MESPLPLSGSGSKIGSKIPNSLTFPRDKGLKREINTSIIRQCLGFLCCLYFEKGLLTFLAEFFTMANFTLQPSLNRWFSRYVIAAMLVNENKRFLISSFLFVHQQFCSIVICVPRDWLQTTYNETTQTLY